MEFRKSNKQQAPKRPAPQRDDTSSDDDARPFKAPTKVTPSQPTALTHTRQFLFTKKTIIISIVVATITISTLATGLSFQHTANKPENKSGKIIDTLDYQTVLPDGKSITELGGWKRISPLDSEPVYAYADTIDNVPVSVSQQVLPKTLSSTNDDQIAELAKKFNATNKIDGGDTVVYIGSSAKGPQSAILTKKDLLILIKSQKKVSDKAWETYVKSLNTLGARFAPKY